MNLRVGAVNVCSYRPFPSSEIVAALKNVKAFTVMERMDDPLAPANPLMRDIKTSFLDAQLQMEEFRDAGVPLVPTTLPSVLYDSQGRAANGKCRRLAAHNLDTGAMPRKFSILLLTTS